MGTTWGKPGLDRLSFRLLFALLLVAAFLEIALCHHGTKSATISTRKVRMETFGEGLRRPRSLRGFMRGRWIERSEPSVSLLRSIALGQPCPSVLATELTAKLLALPMKFCLNIAGIVHGESHMHCRLREPKPTDNRKISSARTALSIFGTSQMRDQHKLELDCILAWSSPGFICQRSDFRSDFSPAAASDKGRIAADHWPPAFKDLSRRSRQCRKVPELRE